MPAQTIPVLNAANVGDFVTKFNEYFTSNGDLASDLYYTLDDPGSPYYIGDRCQIRGGVISKDILSTLNSGHVLQAGRGAKHYNPKEVLKLDGRYLDPKRWKIDLELDWEDIFKEYIQRWEPALKGRVPHESNNIPTLQTYFLTEIFRRAGNDLRQALFKGEYSATLADDGHLQWVDGFNKIIADEIAATNLTPLTGALVTSPSDVIPKIKKMYQALGQGWRDSNSAQILVASNVWFHACETTLMTNNQAYSMFTPEQAMTALSRPLAFAANVKLVHEPNLPEGGMMATVKENLVVGYDSDKLASSLRMQEDKRIVRILADGSACTQIRRVEELIDGAPLVVNEAMA